MLSTYIPRKPLETVLYRVVNDNLKPFLESVETDPERAGLPDYVKREFESYLNCGCYESGITKVRCQENACKADYWVPTSCKGRGFCTSCGGRRMNVVAINLSERVIPWVPTRQWVISMPFALRSWMAADAKLSTAVHRVRCEIQFRQRLEYETFPCSRICN